MIWQFCFVLFFTPDVLSDTTPHTHALITNLSTGNKLALAHRNITHKICVISASMLCFIWSKTKWSWAIIITIIFRGIITCPAEMSRTLHQLWTLSVPVSPSTSEKRLRCLSWLHLTLPPQPALCVRPFFSYSAVPCLMLWGTEERALRLMSELAPQPLCLQTFPDGAIEESMRGEQGLRSAFTISVFFECDMNVFFFFFKVLISL